MMELGVTSICKLCDAQVEMERVSYPKIRALTQSHKGEKTVGSLKVSTEGNAEDGRCITWFLSSPCCTESRRSRLADDWTLGLN